jgi:hypothetical protein
MTFRDETPDSETPIIVPGIGRCWFGGHCMGGDVVLILHGTAKVTADGKSRWWYDRPPQNPPKGPRPNIFA